MPLDNIYCSDLERTRQTAAIIASVHTITPTDCGDLRELNMGDWEGKLFSDCYKRVIPVFERFTESEDTTILIVGHAGVNRVILCRVLGMLLENVFRLEQSYGVLI